MWHGTIVGVVTVLEYLVIAAVIGLVVFVIAVFVFGRGEQMAALSPRVSPAELPDGVIGGEDIRRVRFGIGLRGYRMSDVDWTLDRVSEELDRLHRVVAELGGDPLPPGVLAQPDSAELFAGVGSGAGGEGQSGFVSSFPRSGARPVSHAAPEGVGSGSDDGVATGPVFGDVVAPGYAAAVGSHYAATVRSELTASVRASGPRHGATPSAENTEPAVVPSAPVADESAAQPSVVDETENTDPDGTQADEGRAT